MSEKTKKITVTVPGVNFDKIFGPRDKDMQESVTETKSKLDKRIEKIKDLELEADELDAEREVFRRRKEVDTYKRGDIPEAEAPKSSLESKFMDQVMIPLVNRKLAEDEKGEASGGVVDRALRIAEKAVGQRPAESKEKGALDELDKGVEIFTKIRGLVEGEKEKKKGTGEEPKKEDDYLTQLDKGLDLVAKIRKAFPPEGGGGETSQTLIEFEKWKTQFEAGERKAQREYQLAERRIDKEHDVELAKLGIEKEKNDLLRDGFKRIGRAAALALGEDEDELGEEEEPPAAKGRQQLIKAKCEVCGAEILIPPEAQVAGKEIKCGNRKCGSIFVWE